MILDTILDKTFRRLRNELLIEEIQEKAEMYDNIMASTIECPGCGETIQFVEEDDGRIQGNETQDDND